MGTNMIDDCLWAIEKYLMNRYGVDAAQREIAPIKWYIATGRASTKFIKALAQAKPYVIDRRCHMGGSDEEIIARVKKALGIA